MKKLISCLIACMSLNAVAQAGGITFTTDASNVLTSVTFTDLTFTLTSDLNESMVQVRILDAYSSSVGSQTMCQTGTGLDILVGSTTYSMAESGVSSFDINADNSWTDIIFYLSNTNDDTMDWKLGQTVTFNGTVNLSSYGPGMTYMITPDSVSGLSMYLAEPIDGSAISDLPTYDITVSTVPEPATYTMFAGMGVLGLALLGKRKGWFKR